MQNTWAQNNLRKEESQREHMMHCVEGPNSYVRDDPWHEGKYQVEMEAKYGDRFEEVNKLLEAGSFRFYPIKIDERWNLYLSLCYADVKANLKEVDKHNDLLRLIIMHGNLEKDKVSQARDELYALYDSELT